MTTCLSRFVRSRPMRTLTFLAGVLAGVPSAVADTRHDVDVLLQFVEQATSCNAHAEHVSAYVEYGVRVGIYAHGRASELRGTVEGLKDRCWSGDPEQASQQLVDLLTALATHDDER